jgi:hypothetical protein
VPGVSFDALRKPGNLPHRLARWGKQGARAPKKEPEGLAVARFKRTYSTKITRKMRQPLASSHIKPYHYTGFFIILQEKYAIF